MFENMKLKVIQLLLKKYALGYIVKAYDAVKGHKTQIFLALAILTWIGETLKVIPTETAKQLYEVFGGAGSVTFLSKMARYQPVIDQLVNQAKNEVKS